MKKSLSHHFFFLLPIALILTGCASETPVIHDEDEVTYMSCENGDSALSYSVAGDRVVYIEQTIRTDRDKLGIPQDLSQEQLDMAVSSAVSNMYEDLDGVDAQAQINGDQILISVKMDLEKADLEALSERGVLTDAVVSTNYVSWTKTKEALEAEQIACQPAEK